MSGEIQADIADAYRRARQIVESDVNKRLKELRLSSKIAEWTFIAIIRTEDHPDYGEVTKKYNGGKGLEFRLKINHKEFRDSSQGDQTRQVLIALKRSVELMSQMGVNEDDRNRLLEMLDASTASLTR